MTEQQYLDNDAHEKVRERVELMEIALNGHREHMRDMAGAAAAHAAAIKPTGIDATLDERGARYGKFTGHARITQGLKIQMHEAPNWHLLAPDQKEALDMVAHKIGRILNGDPDYHDSWHDIVGYTKLVADRLLGIEK